MRNCTFSTPLRDGGRSQLSTEHHRKSRSRQTALENTSVLDVIRPVSRSPARGFQFRANFKAVSEPTICALTRAVEKDIDVACDALRLAKHKRIHTVSAMSPQHIYDKLRSTPEDSPGTGCRASEICQLCRGVSSTPRMPDAPMSSIWPAWSRRPLPPVPPWSIPDTTVLPPERIRRQIRTCVDHIVQHRPGHHFDPLPQRSGHGRNTLSGVLVGARQAEVMINGIGERAGNTSLEGW